MATNLHPTGPSVLLSAEAVEGVMAERPLRQQSNRKTSTATGKDKRIASKPVAAAKRRSSILQEPFTDARPEEVT